MALLKKLIKFEEALNTLLNLAKPINEVEELPIIKAYQRVLAEDIVSPFDIPFYPRASMDGYAVKASDTFFASPRNNVVLKYKGRLRTGEVKNLRVNKGECVAVATGAPLPPGSDAVVMLEFTELEGRRVKIKKPVYPGESVSLPGEDIEKGEKVLRKGEMLTASKIGVLAALGKTKVKVYRKPRVKILPTGEEIVPPGQPLKKGKIYDINSYTIFTLIIESGGIPFLSPSLPDKKEIIEGSLKETQNVDVLIFIGGTSVGEKDLIPEVLSKHGKIYFHGVQTKPGKPFLCGEIEEKIILGLPGYPASCLIIGYVFLKPFLKKMAHLPYEEKTVWVKMGENVYSPLGRHQFLTVKIEGDKAYPVFKESGDITSISQAQGIVHVPENQEIIEKGEKVKVYLF